VDTLETTTTTTITSTPPDLVATSISTIETTVDTTTATTEYDTATSTVTTTLTTTIFDLPRATLAPTAGVKGANTPLVNFHHKKCRKVIHYKDVYTTKTKTVFVASGLTSTTLAPSTTFTTDTVTETGTFTKPQETTTTTTSTTSTDSTTITDTITSATATVTTTVTAATQTVHAYTGCDPTNLAEAIGIGANTLVYSVSLNSQLLPEECCADCLSNPSCHGFAAAAPGFCAELIFIDPHICTNDSILLTGPGGIGAIFPCV